MKFLSHLLLITFAVCPGLCQAQNKGWIPIFTGHSTDHLRGYMMNTFPSDAWKVVDGALEAQTGVPNVDLVTKKSYKNFELSLDWKVSKAGNSGVFYYIVERSAHESHNGNSPNWLDNFEMQILDDINFNDTAAIRSAGSLYDLIAPTHKKLMPIGAYNHARLVVNHGHVEHWLNGRKIIEYELGSAKIKKLIAGSKYKDNPNFAKSTNGLIMFQHHGQKVWLKNIMLKPL